jgi:hypothetical protein
MGEGAILGIMELDQRNREYQGQSALINAQIQHMKAQQKSLDTQAELEAAQLMLERGKWDSIQKILGGGATHPGSQYPPEGAAQPLPQQIAAGQFGGFDIDKIDPIKGSITLKPTEYTTISNVAGEGGTPQNVRVPANRPGSYPQAVKLEERKQTLPDGTTVSYEVNPYTGQPAGAVQAKVSGAPAFRVSAPAPVEEFKFTGQDGVDYSVIRNKQTGAPMTAPVPIAPPKGALPGDAGKIEGISKGQENLKAIRSALVNKDGSVNQGLVWKMAAPMGGVGEGRRLNSLFREAIDVKIRAMTGAAISKEELPFYESTYLPHPLDPDELKIDKLNRLESFLQGYGAAVDPAGISTGRVNKATAKKGAPPLLGKKEAPKKRFKVDASGRVTEVK